MNEYFIAGAFYMFCIVILSIVLLTIRDKLKARKSNPYKNTGFKSKKRLKINLLRDNKPYNFFRNKTHQKLDNTYDYINTCWDEIEKPKKFRR